MWWLFVKYQETEDEIVYHHSMESNDLDGENVWYKKSQRFDVTRPCRLDADNQWCIGRTRQHFFTLVHEGFPDKRYVLT